MGSDELRLQTASERLTLNEEYQMQKDWMSQNDKATFIILSKEMYRATANETEAMIGDINIFLVDPNDKSLAEIEVMIAETHGRGKGHGYEACLLMIYYGFTELGIKTFQAKIGYSNAASLHLFEKKLHFHQVSKSDVFKEVTLHLQPSDDFIKNIEKCGFQWIQYDFLKQLQNI